MKPLRVLFIALLLACAAPTFTGCQTTTPPTAEAAKYYTMRDTWNAALEVYKGYASLAVQGKVTQRDQQDIDRAWNAFRAALKIALTNQQNDWSAITPENVDALRNDLITLIKSL